MVVEVTFEGRYIDGDLFTDLIETLVLIGFRAGIPIESPADFSKEDFLALMVLIREGSVKAMVQAGATPEECREMNAILIKLNHPLAR